MKSLSTYYLFLVCNMQSSRNSQSSPYLTIICSAANHSICTINGFPQIKPSTYVRTLSTWNYYTLSWVQHNNGLACMERENQELYRRRWQISNSTCTPITVAFTHTIRCRSISAKLHDVINAGYL